MDRVGALRGDGKADTRVTRDVWEAAEILLLLKDAADAILASEAHGRPAVDVNGRHEEGREEDTGLKEGGRDLVAVAEPVAVPVGKRKRSEEEGAEKKGKRRSAPKKESTPLVKPPVVTRAGREVRPWPRFD